LRSALEDRISMMPLFNSRDRLLLAPRRAPTARPMARRGRLDDKEEGISGRAFRDSPDLALWGKQNQR